MDTIFASCFIFQFISVEAYSAIANSQRLAGNFYYSTQNYNYIATSQPHIARHSSILTVITESSGILAVIKLILNFIKQPFGAVGEGDSQPAAMFNSRFSTEPNITRNESLFYEFFDKEVATPFPYTPDDYKVPSVAIGFGAISAAAFIANLLLFGYILWQKLYKNFISSQFIAHLCITNAVGLALFTPMIIYSFWTGESPWISNNGMCRLQVIISNINHVLITYLNFQAFGICSIWSVVYYMVLCIAGVHVLTFARIHYDQLFGLPPARLCILAWIVSLFLALPCITNGYIVGYDPTLRMCIWGRNDASYKFLTYYIFLGVVIPMTFVYYAYLRVLAILYHSPIVFQSIGLYKSRFLVYGFIFG